MDAIRDSQVQSLLLDDACRVVVGHLRAAGVPFIMLKGATVANWLYANPAHRTYSDLDILVAPSAESAVVELLGRLGYRPLLDARSVRVINRGEQPLRNDRGLTVDLHVALSGVRLAPESAWEILLSETVTEDWYGTQVPALGLPARALHLGLHLAKRGLVDTKAAKDLQLGLDQLDDQLWRAAADLGRRLDALEAFAAGLVLLADGADVADRLGLSAPKNVENLMRTASVFGPAVALERILTSQSRWQRVRTAAGYLFPSAEWLRFVDPHATASRRGLLRARLHRPFRVVRRALLAHHERRRFRLDRRSG